MFTKPYPQVPHSPHPPSEHFQRFHHFPGHPVPRLDHSFSDQIFPNIQSKLLVQLESVSPHPVKLVPLVGTQVFSCREGSWGRKSAHTPPWALLPPGEYVPFFCKCQNWQSSCSPQTHLLFQALAEVVTMKAVSLWRTYFVWMGVVWICSIPCSSHLVKPG